MGAPRFLRLCDLCVSALIRDSGSSAGSFCSEGASDLLFKNGRAATGRLSALENCERYLPDTAPDVSAIVRATWGA